MNNINIKQDKTYIEFEYGKAEVTLQMKHGTTYFFGNVPFGVEYKVTEKDYEGQGYKTTYKDNFTGGTISVINKTVKIENKNDHKINTGITIDNLPYILGFSVVKKKEIDE